ncbi:hypothetical protein J2S25_003457 [Mesobacillus stamsii]|uniref:DUF4258 domain-containing protein n=1 Tax=Mesobacillus stamsii TaxID=225347 RepID=A0ABU0FZG4_9BACI|nr:hypothetical protein [Mesobacillus stamsii]
MRVYLSYLNRKNTCQSLSDRESLTKNLESLGFFDKKISINIRKKETWIWENTYFTKNGFNEFKIIYIIRKGREFNNEDYVICVVFSS